MMVLSLLALAVAADPQANPAAQGSDAAALYAKFCALCHGAEREGLAADYAPSLRSPQLYTLEPPGYVYHTIQYGRPGTAMPAFADSLGGPLSGAEIGEIYRWLYARAGASEVPVPSSAKPVRGDPRRGAALYASACASCHGSKGEGVTAPALGNPVFLALAPDRFIFDTISQGRSGTAMPAFQTTLSPQEIAGVTAYLRSRAAGWTAPEAVSVSLPSPDSYVLNPLAPPASFNPRDGRYVPSADVYAATMAGQRLVLIDARVPSDWATAHIPGAVPVPWYDVDSVVQHLPNDDTWIIAYCACPHAASGKVVDTLRARGFNKVAILDEGILWWAGQGYPLMPGTVR